VCDGMMHQHARLQVLHSCLTTSPPPIADNLENPPPFMHTPGWPRRWAPSGRRWWMIPAQQVR
jgi:hypothetical protein